MSLVRWDPFEELSILRGRADRLFVDSTGVPSTPSRNWLPACDIFEAEQEIVIEVDLPGINKEDVNIELTGEVLSLAGELNRRSDASGETAERGEGYHRVERPHGRFQRSFTLATEVDREGITASFDRGVLTIKLPKAKTVRPKQITINVSGASTARSV